MGQGFDEIRIEISGGGLLELEGVSLGSEGYFIYSEATIVSLDDVEHPRSRRQLGLVSPG